MSETPIKYVKDKGGKFMPITTPNAVIDEEGKTLPEVYVKKEILGTQVTYTLSGSKLYITTKEYNDANGV